MAKKKSPDLSHLAEQLRPLAVRCDSLVMDPANAKKHPEKNLEAIKGSLRSFGQVKPLVVREETRVVCCGNGTLTAARALGWEWIAANVIPLSDHAAVALAIADNRTADLGEWDHETLDALTRSLEVVDDALQGMLDDLRTELPTTAPLEAEQCELPDIGGVETQIVTLRFRKDDEWIIKRFIGKAETELLEPVHTGGRILERIKAIVTDSADHK